MEAQNQKGTILIAYFSWSGNAKALAEQIARETGGVLFEKKTEKVYIKDKNINGSASPTTAIRGYAHRSLLIPHLQKHVKHLKEEFLVFRRQGFKVMDQIHEFFVRDFGKHLAFPISKVGFVYRKSAADELYQTFINHFFSTLYPR
jgi:hypothetical protein